MHTYPHLTLSYKSIGRDFDRYVNSTIEASVKTGFSKKLDKIINRTDILLQIIEEYLKLGLVSLILNEIKRQCWWAEIDFRADEKEDHRGDLGRLLLGTIQLFKKYAREDTIKEVVLIVIKRQISQVSYNYKGSVKFKIDVDAAIEESLVALKGGVEMARRVLVDPCDKAALLNIEILAAKAERAAKKVLAKDKSSYS